MRRLALALVAALLLCPSVATAHEVPDVVRIAVYLKPEDGRMLMLVRMPVNAFIDFLFPAFADGGLDLPQAEAMAAEGAMVWIADLLSLSEGGVEVQKPRVLRTRISRLNDPFFTTFQDALTHMDAAGLPADSFVTGDQAAVDALLEAPIHDTGSRFSLEPRFGRLGVLVYTTLTFLGPDGRAQPFFYEGDPVAFELNPDRGHALARFWRAGIAHYFDEREYLLFVLCVALVLPRVRPLVPFAAALAGVEFLTLVAFLAWMPAFPWLPAVSAVLVAALTAYTGIEAVIAGDGRRLGLAAGSGVVLGTTFWSALQPMLQFGGAHAFAAGLGFAAGVVVSELAALCLLVVAVKVALKWSRAPRAAVTIAAAVAIHVSWRRLLDRSDALTLAPFPVPTAEIVRMAVVGAALVALVTGAAVYWRSNRTLRMRSD